MRNLRRGAMAAILTVLATVGLPGPGKAGESPGGVVRRTADEVMAILADSSLGAEAKREKIEAIVSTHFDFVILSRLVLARNWKQMNPAQQEEFVAEFRKHLSVTYGRNVERYENEKAEVTGERQEADGDWTVRTRILRPAGEPVLVDYRLRQRETTWLVIDVIIEGTSLVANFRSQFQDIVSRDGVAGLLDLLRQKNARGESLKS